MIKSLTAQYLTGLAIFALLGVTAIALPGFAPPVKARETVALAKADRLASHPAARNCLGQVWPDFEASCLRRGESDAGVHEARLVTARR